MSKNRHLTEQEWDEICRLREAGKTHRQISTLMGRPKATIQYVLNNEKPDYTKIKKVDPYKSKYNFKDLVEVDLSTIPDTVLFQHSKEYLI